MAGKQENLKVVQDAFAAFLRGDIPAILAACDSSIEVEFYGPPTLPMAGHFKGHAGLQDYLNRVVTAIEFLQFVPQEFVCEEESVVVLGYTKARARATDREGRISWTVVFTMSNGRISRYRVYEDTATLAQVLGATG